MDPDHPRIIVRPGAHGLSVGIEDRDVLSFDRTGRPSVFFLDGVTFKRGLDNRVLEICPAREGGRRVRRRRFLEADEADVLFRRGREILTRVRERLAAGDVEVTAPGGATLTVDGIAARIDAALARGPAELARDRERFLAAYGPIGILPPDQYLSVLLQGTEGCSHNRCTFCGFYRHVPFRIKTPEAFARHIEAVRDFFGDAIGRRRTIFLADANAMVIPRNRLRPMMEAIGRAFAIDGVAGTRGDGDGPRPGNTRPRVRGVYSFIDSFSGPMKETDDFAELRRLGLRRLYLGVETGSDRLLRFLEKPGSARHARTLIRRIRDADVRVGVIVMAGIGGARFAKEHVEETIAHLRAMKLGAGDILYISDFSAPAGTEYIERAGAARLGDLDDEAVAAQRRTIAAALAPSARARGFRIAPYSIHDFVY